MPAETGEATRRDALRVSRNFAQTANITATLNNEVVNPQSATATTPKGGKTPTRVVETRDMWAVVFDHTATLLAKAVNGIAVEPDDVAQSVALGLWPKFNWDKNVGGAEPKQAKSLIAAVIAKL